jgi:hypothetical protein
MEKKLLQIQKHIIEFGLDQTIEKFKLKIRTYENKVILKYDQIESDMSLKEVQECRGLILDRNNWDVLSFSFKKFFNYGESNSARIDLASAVVLEKLDGTLIQLYHDPYKDEWIAGTTGTAEGEGEVNSKYGTTFNDLFWKTLEKYSFDNNKLHKGFTYMFELTTPENIVVKPHTESNATLIGMRSNVIFEEFKHDELIAVGEYLGIPVIKCYDFTSLSFDELNNSLKNMPWSEEGYVVVDKYFNRVKIKNPEYVAVHHLKSKNAEHNIINIIKSNEIEEFISTFSERKDEILKLKENYDKLISDLSQIWVELDYIKPKDKSSLEKKNFALAVFEITKKYNLELFSNLYFSLENGRVNSINEYILEYDNKKLYKIL